MKLKETLVLYRLSNKHIVHYRHTPICHYKSNYKEKPNMAQYDIKCPICGTINRGLYLEETHGWMVCENCNILTGNMEYMRKHSKKVPVITMKPPTRIASQGKI